MPRILVIEDDATTSRLITALLKELGHDCEVASTLAEAEKSLERNRYELITLDIRLPDGDGFEFCERLRKRRLETPVIMLTTEVSAESVVRGIEAGAADYLRKPIDSKELQARLRGHLRAVTGTSLLEFHELSLDPERRTLHHKGRKLELKGRQFDLLACFLRRPEVVITREQLIAAMGGDDDLSDRTIDSHVSQLRAKLKSQHVTSLSLTAIYRVGYRLE